LIIHNALHPHRNWLSFRSRSRAISQFYTRVPTRMRISDTSNHHELGKVSAWAKWRTYIPSTLAASEDEPWSHPCTSRALVMLPLTWDWTTPFGAPRRCIITKRKDRFLGDSETSKSSGSTTWTWRLALDLGDVLSIKRRPPSRGNVVWGDRLF